MTFFFEWILVIALSLFGGICGAAEAPAPCQIDDGALHIQVQVESDDGTLEPGLAITLSDHQGTLSRLFMTETRILEACWWDPIAIAPKPLLVISVGADATNPAAVRLLSWNGSLLQPVKVPALAAAEGGAYRYVVKDHHLWALPLSDDSGGPYQLRQGGWSKMGRALTPKP